MLNIKKWYNSKDDEDVHDDVFATIRSIQNNQSVIRRNMQKNIRMYGQSIQTMVGQSNIVSIDDFSDRLNINVCAMAVDTIFNKITKSKPKVQFLTEEGNWKNQTKAKKLNKFIQGQFYQTSFDKVRPLVFRDGSVAGSGFAKIFRSGKEIKVERVFPGEIVVDELEGIYGNPKIMYQIKLVSRDALIGMFPNKKDRIMNARSNVKSGDQGFTQTLIWVAEGWKISNNEAEPNGRHVICIDGATLLNEDWKKQFHPFAKFDWKKRMLGYMGSSLIDEIFPVQIEVTRVCKKIQQTFDASVLRIFLDYSSNVIKSHFNKDVGSFVYFEGNPPIISNPPGVDTALFQWLQWLIQQSLEVPGISMMSAQGKKPMGLDSGKAIREISDIESERFYKIAEAYEDFAVDSAKIMIEYAKDIAEEFGEYSVIAKDTDGFQMIKWSEIDLKEDAYVMQPYPASFFSQTPQGQIQDAYDLLNLGAIDQKTIGKVFNFPDVKQVLRHKNAAQDLIEKIVDQMVSTGEYTPPEPFMDLNYGLWFVQSQYNLGKIDNMPEEKLELLREWLSDAKQLSDKAKQEAMAQQAMAQQAAQPQAQMMPPQGVA